MERQDEKENNPPKSDKRFSLWYIGWSSLDRRTTLPMLPWLVAEIRRKSDKNDSGPIQAREVQLVLIPPFIRCVPSNNANSSVFIFEHKAQLISRFVHNSNDLTYFAYLIRGQPDNPESEMSCHVFKACDPNQVGLCWWGYTWAHGIGYNNINNMTPFIHFSNRLHVNGKSAPLLDICRPFSQKTFWSVIDGQTQL